LAWPAEIGLRYRFSSISTATTSELDAARVACRFLSGILDHPKNWRGVVIIGNTPMPWRPIQLLSSLWRTPVVRAATIGFSILGMRKFKSALSEDGAAAFASRASEVRVLRPDSA
jgi:hypothetical protein